MDLERKDIKETTDPDLEALDLEALEKNLAALLPQNTGKSLLGLLRSLPHAELEDIMDAADAYENNARRIQALLARSR